MWTRVWEEILTRGFSCLTGAWQVSHSLLPPRVTAVTAPFGHVTIMQCGVVTSQIHISNSVNNQIIPKTLNISPTLVFVSSFWTSHPSAKHWIVLEEMDSCCQSVHLKIQHHSVLALIVTGHCHGESDEFQYEWEISAQLLKYKQRS